MVWNGKLLIDDQTCSFLKNSWIGLGFIINATVQKSNYEQINELKNVENNIKSKLTIENIIKHPIIRTYRDFYWRIRIDPTKQRPSSEALIRRVLQNKSIPTINNVVDAGNIASLLTFIPIGLYDADNIEGTITLRLSKSNEYFVPIGGEKEVVKEGQPILADNKRIIHLYPHRDSSETMITHKTKNILVLSLGVPSISKDLINEALEETLKLITKYSGGQTAETRIIKIC
ncbi:MAG: phenylalanine--tRNA ligase beta subunit-related protein [Thermoprotei archaeon]